MKAKQVAQAQVAVELEPKTSIEVELEALATITGQIQVLDKDARVRTMKYILDRFSIWLPSNY